MPNQKPTGREIMSVSEVVNVRLLLIKYVRYTAFSLKRYQHSLNSQDECDPLLFVVLFCLGLCSSATSLLPLIRIVRYHTRMNAMQMRWTNWYIQTYMKATYFCILLYTYIWSKLAICLRVLSSFFMNTKLKSLGLSIFVQTRKTALLQRNANQKYIQVYKLCTPLK